MAHHSKEMSAEVTDLFRKAADELELGATGRFPDGHLNKVDEGEIKFAIAADHKNNLIHINFGTPVVWLSLTQEQADQIEDELRRKRLELQTAGN